MVRRPNNPLDIAVVRLAELERNIERRYLKLSSDKIRCCGENCVQAVGVGAGVTGYAEKPNDATDSSTVHPEASFGLSPFVFQRKIQKESCG